MCCCTVHNEQSLLMMWCMVRKNTEHAPTQAAGGHTVELCSLAGTLAPCTTLRRCRSSWGALTGGAHVTHADAIHGHEACLTVELRTCSANVVCLELCHKGV